MAAPVAILAVLAFIASVQGVVPPGYVLDISPDCGANGISDAAVHLMTDFDAEAKAICAGNKEVSFTTHDGVFFNLPVSYPTSGKSTCKFVKKKDAFVYTILVIVAFGSPGSRLHQSDERYTVTCSFQPGGNKKSFPLTIKPGDTAPRVVEGNTPPKSPSVIHLYLVNIVGKKITGSVSAGKSVRLKAVTLGPSDKGIRPESCDAVNSKGARFSILRSGCGDGMVMKQTKGFRTYGKVAYSAFFKLFTVNGDPQLSIDCNFTICAKTCNGPSCYFEWRRRRELPGDGAGNFHRSSISFARTEMITLNGVSDDVLPHPAAPRPRA
ncbi:vitelline envelope sperm lysin receptor-like [Haliotis rubra]|uniref:vitelline envelope sperm lysin receptor-like n=1 Tax=Haliotis rubra TaxID=36100 RepID=UPI001EE5143F|nr:vitelline envelope sperm lysin receptor-like [Haliotis rubra]